MFDGVVVVAVGALVVFEKEKVGVLEEAPAFPKIPPDAGAVDAVSFDGALDELGVENLNDMMTDGGLSVLFCKKKRRGQDCTGCPESLVPHEGL